MNGYGIVKSLAKEGVPVCGFYTEKGEFGRFSKYCKSVYSKDVSQDEESVCQLLLEEGAKYDDRPVLFPTNDQYAVFLAKNQKKLEKYFLFHWVPLATLDSIVDKLKVSHLCEKACVLVPRTHLTYFGEDLAESVKHFSFPCLIKPAQSFNTTFPSSMKNFVAQQPEDLISFYARYSGLLGKTLWQEIVEGQDDAIFQCTGLVQKTGEIGPLFYTRKIHQYPPGYGIMCLGRSESNVQVASEAMKFLESLDYTGLASIEFKYDQHKNRYYFIEMNPRLPWYNSLFNDAGINLPFLAYLDLAKGLTHSAWKGQQEDGIYWVSFKEELGWYWRIRQIGGTGLIQWLRLVKNWRSFAWWNLQDPVPFCLGTFDFFKKAMQKVLKRIFPFFHQKWS